MLSYNINLLLTWYILIYHMKSYSGYLQQHPVSLKGIISSRNNIYCETLTVSGSGRLASCSMTIFLASSRFFSLLSLSSVCTANMEQTCYMPTGHIDVWIQAQLEQHTVKLYIKGTKTVQHSKLLRIQTICVVLF